MWLSFEQVLHLFPSGFGIVLCILSRFDNIWIDAKISSELNTSRPPASPAQVGLTQEIANGAAAFAAYIPNTLLFIIGSLLAIFDWPKCLENWLLLVIGPMFCIPIVFVVVTLVQYPLSVLERPSPIMGTNLPSVWTKLKAIPLGYKLFWIQVTFNLLVLILTLSGFVFGGGGDTRGICKGGA